MTCEELLAYLSRYLDEDLDEELTRAARLHLATCQNCQVALNTTQQVILLGHEQTHRVIPLERRGRLFAHLQEAFSQRRTPPASDSAQTC